MEWAYLSCHTDCRIIVLNSKKKRKVISKFLCKLIFLHDVLKPADKETFLEVTTADRHLCNHTFIGLLYLSVSQSQRDMNSLCVQNQITHGWRNVTFRFPTDSSHTVTAPLLNWCSYSLPLCCMCNKHTGLVLWLRIALYQMVLYSKLVWSTTS